MAPLILIGLWLERWLIVAPDLHGPSNVAATVVITLVFTALFVGSVRLPRSYSFNGR